MPSFISRLRSVLSVIGATLLLVACAHNPTTFTPPDARPVSTINKPWPANHVLALAYHDVEDSDPDQRFLAVRTDLFVAQMHWLKNNGYHPVSVDQILAAHRGEKPLPPKAVLLSFDDGYRSFYTKVFPILKAFNWPAVWAPVGAWVSTPPNKKVDFGGLMRPRQQFATWDEVRQIAQSGLVDIGSHTNASHMGILANPQGNKEPAATTHRYNPKTKTYESDAAYRQRINKDVAAITKKLTEVTGKKPRVWVWPYGAANGEALDIVRKHGYKMALTLDDGLGTVNRLMSMPRMLVANSPNMSQFAQQVLNVESAPHMRVAQVDLDYVYDPDPVQTNRNLGALVERIARLHIDTVFLQAFSDPNGDGLVKSVYFPNHWLPMRADLFNRTVWQLQTRAHVKVYAWMPVLSFDLDPSIARVARWNPDHPRRKPEVAPDRYQRLSPFDPKARKAIIGLYEDMARNAPVNGILFHDDALLRDDEDASPPAIAAYQKTGFPESIQAIRSNPETLQRWTRFKSQYLIHFTQTLTQHVRAILGPDIKTARNIYARPVMQPKSEAWFAQNMHDFLKAYDWTVIMAMPLMEGVSPHKTKAWLSHLVTDVKHIPGALKKTVFELQSFDWHGSHATYVNPDVLTGWMRLLQRQGVQSFGYYPDDFINNHPPLKKLRPAISNAWYPYETY